MLLVHKVELKPNNKQATYFRKACGVARFAYNWALDQWKQQYRNGEKPTEISLRKLLNARKTEEYPWMQEVTKNAPQQAIKNLGSAFNRFFRKQGGYPSLKRKASGIALERIMDHPRKESLPSVWWVKRFKFLVWDGSK